MKILLTGSTGLLGSHILDQGLKRDYQFILPYRKIKKRSYLSEVQEHKNITLIEYNFKNSINLLSLDKVDTVINSAAFVSPFEKDNTEMEFINHDFPKRLYTEAQRKGVEFFCQISSNSVFGTKDKNLIINEGDTSAPRNTPYTQSKLRFDHWLQEQNQLPHGTIHPGYMLDRYDSKPSSGALILALKMKKFKNYHNRIKNIVSAQDVANATLDLCLLYTSPSPRD